LWCARVCLTDADVEKTERVKKASLADAAEDLLDAFGQEHEIERDAGIDDQVSIFGLGRCWNKMSASV